MHPKADEQDRLQAQTNEQYAKIEVLQAELTSALVEKGALQMQVAAAAENAECERAVRPTC